MRGSSSSLMTPITPATAATTATIARPPPRGVLRVWLLRALGASMMPFAVVHSIRPRVSTAAATTAAMHHADQRPIDVIVRLSAAVDSWRSTILRGGHRLADVVHHGLIHVGPDG